MIDDCNEVSIREAIPNSHFVHTDLNNGKPFEEEGLTKLKADQAIEFLQIEVCVSDMFYDRK